MSSFYLWVCVCVCVRVCVSGRLDKNTTGLLLLTNDGYLTSVLTHTVHAFVSQLFLHSFLSHVSNANVGTSASLWPSMTRDVSVARVEAKERERARENEREHAGGGVQVSADASSLARQGVHLRGQSDTPTCCAFLLIPPLLDSSSVISSIFGNIPKCTCPNMSKETLKFEHMVLC